MADKQDNLQIATSDATAEQMTSDDFFAALDASINPLESDFVDANTEGNVPAQVETVDNSQSVEADEKANHFINKAKYLLSNGAREYLD